VQFHRHFNARQRFAFPLLTSAFPYCSLALPCFALRLASLPLLHVSKQPAASPLRFCARRLFTLPFHRASIHLNAIAKQCFASRFFALAFLCAATLYFAIPLLNNAPLLFATPLLYQALLTALCFAIPSLYLASPYAALPPLRIAQPNLAVAFPGASRRLVPMPSHRVSLLLNTSPSLCKTSPSGSVAAPRQAPLFHCVAEIRIAPQSLCCSSGSKTELSLSYAVLGRAALRLSVAIFALHHSAIPCLASLCSSFAVLSIAEHC
jgi:hypothetical protein